MPKRRRVSGVEVITALEQLGFVRLRQKGSHVMLRRETDAGAIGCVVPLHDDVAVGALRGICRQAHVTLDDIYENL
ncbi:MAG: type II toxin-antitoxin system HicA family toxin [Anaerolineales bacterium]